MLVPVVPPVVLVPVPLVPLVLVPAPVVPPPLLEPLLAPPLVLPPVLDPPLVVLVLWSVPFLLVVVLLGLSGPQAAVASRLTALTAPTAHTDVRLIR